MNLLFINYHTLDGNSALHQVQLAAHLAADDLAPAIAVTRGAAGAAGAGRRFGVLTHRDVRAGRFPFPDGRGPDLVHAWTPRECVRRVAEGLAARQGCPYLVHLEDNEMAILERSTGMTADAFARLPGWRQWTRSFHRLSHPAHARRFLAGARGVTVLLDRLREFVPPGVPVAEFWPAFDETVIRPGPADPGHRRQLGLADDDLVVFYPGNLNAVNREDVCDLYRAIALANARGVPARLVRTGLVDHVHPVKRLRLPPGYFRDLGFVARAEVGRLYRLADVLVQPGRPDAYNDYRFPSKLPEFFASGRPVLLPRTNVGRHATGGENCLWLESGTPGEVAGHLARLHRDPALRERLGRAGRAFAESRFRWPQAAATLRAFYRQVLDGAGIGD